ncbi:MULTISPECIES: hypothetical protein [Geomonas]|uniref:hypothetical protein n=1 Tax=Geomonas TaxID=2651583 RepID=UPI00100BC5BD|nr:MULTISPECIES: hypothetical protein [Geomonas]
MSWTRSLRIEVAENARPSALSQLPPPGNIGEHPLAALGRQIKDLADGLQNIVRTYTVPKKKDVEVPPKSTSQVGAALTPPPDPEGGNPEPSLGPTRDYSHLPTPFPEFYPTAGERINLDRMRFMAHLDRLYFDTFGTEDAITEERKKVILRKYNKIGY